MQDRCCWQTRVILYVSIKPPTRYGHQNQHTEQASQLTGINVHARGVIKFSKVYAVIKQIMYNGNNKNLSSTTDCNSVIDTIIYHWLHLSEVISIRSDIYRRWHLSEVTSIGGDIYRGRHLSEATSILGDIYRRRHLSRAKSIGGDIYRGPSPGWIYPDSRQSRAKCSPPLLLLRASPRFSCEGPGRYPREQCPIRPAAAHPVDCFGATGNEVIYCP